MRTSSGISGLLAACVLAVMGLGATMVGSQAQTALDAASQLARGNAADADGLSGDNMLAALESAADAGQPIALWRLGLMYENGEGVTQDRVKAFGYFARIANDHADTAPRGIEADIVAQSFVKMGDYYRDGLPDAGIKADSGRAHALILHAASYFGDADAQYRVGRLYLDDNELGRNPLQSARWLSLAARKGHGPAQAVLGDLLFNGDGIEAQPVEGLMWLNVAITRVAGTSDESWVRELLERDMALASPGQRAEAINAAAGLPQRFGGLN